MRSVSRRESSLIKYKGALKTLPNRTRATRRVKQSLLDRQVTLADLNQVVLHRQCVEH